MRPAALAAAAALLAAAGMAEAQAQPDMWTQFAEIVARDPETRQAVETARGRFSDAGEAVAGWEQAGVDTDALLAALPGGLDANLLADPGRPGESDGELRSSRPLSEIVPAGWTQILRYGEVDLHPRHAAILFISPASLGHVVFARARRWRQGNASCWGPIRGVAVYRPAGAPADDPVRLALETAASFASARGQAMCERFEGDLARGFTRMSFLPDGRPLVGINRRTAGARSVARPLAQQLRRD